MIWIEEQIFNTVKVRLSFSFCFTCGHLSIYSTDEAITGYISWSINLQPWIASIVSTGIVHFVNVEFINFSFSIRSVVPHRGLSTLPLVVVQNTGDKHAYFFSSGVPILVGCVNTRMQIYASSISSRLNFLVNEIKYFIIGFGANNMDEVMTESNNI